MCIDVKKEGYVCVVSGWVGGRVRGTGIKGGWVGRGHVTT